MSKKQSNKFNFFVPISFQKGVAESGDLPEILEIEGVASAEVEDVDGETLEPIGFDYRPFLEKGFLNWNHQANKTATAIIGEPTEAKIIAGGKKFWIKGYLYKGDPEAEAVYRKGLTLEKSSKKRRLGFSIEGQAIERDPINPKRITKARITGCAITASPKNPNTLMSIVKGEYNEAFVDDEDEEETEKSMTAEGTVDLSVESIDGVKKTNARSSTQVAQTLKKSEIYNRILNDYTKDATIAKGIYDYIITATKKLGNMDITQDVLNKALAFLDNAIEKGDSKPPFAKKDEGEKDEKEPEGNKADEAGTGDDETITKGEGADEDDEQAIFDKACAMAKGFLDKGLNKGQMLDEMVKAGVQPSVAAGACDRCIADANANKDGGDVNQHSPAGFNKGIEDALTLLVESNNNLQKSIDTQNANIDSKFTAVGTVLKGVLGFSDELQKSVTQLTERLGKLESQPNPRKSTTNVQALERFQKSEDGISDDNTYSISKADDKRALINRLGAVAEQKRAAGRQNTILEKAIANLEIAGTLGTERDLHLMAPEFQALGIKVIA